LICFEMTEYTWYSTERGGLLGVSVSKKAATQTGGSLNRGEMASKERKDDVVVGVKKVLLDEMTKKKKKKSSPL